MTTKVPLMSSLHNNNGTLTMSYRGSEPLSFLLDVHDTMSHFDRNMISRLDKKTNQNLTQYQIEETHCLLYTKPSGVQSPNKCVDVKRTILIDAGHLCMLLNREAKDGQLTEIGKHKVLDFSDT